MNTGLGFYDLTSCNPPPRPPFFHLFPHIFLTRYTHIHIANPESNNTRLLITKGSLSLESYDFINFLSTFNFFHLSKRVCHFHIEGNCNIVADIVRCTSQDAWILKDTTIIFFFFLHFHLIFILNTFEYYPQLPGVAFDKFTL